MSQTDKLLERLLQSETNTNIPFEGLCNLLYSLGFESRQGGGSHRIFYKEGVVEILNLQPGEGGKAKPYQVKQVRDVIRKYNLGRR